MWQIVGSWKAWLDNRGILVWRGLRVLHVKVLVCRFKKKRRCIKCSCYKNKFLINNSYCRIWSFGEQMSANEWACEHYYPLSICYLTISGQIIFLLCFNYQQQISSFFHSKINAYQIFQKKKLKQTVSL
jgi:hypothetical protein